MSRLPEHLVAKPEHLAAACRHLAEAKVFGFDTEFVGEHSFHPELCLIQAATAERLFIIDPLALSDLTPFWNVLTDPSNLAIVHAGREEIRLCRLACGRLPGRVFDVQLAAGFVGLAYPMSHAGLVDQLLGVRLSKAETLTDWRARPLSPKQVRYAFNDVRHLLTLHRMLAEDLARRGRQGWAEEEFIRLAETATDEAQQRERWRKLPGLGKLSSRQLAVARSLFAWRLQRAEELGRPARFLCRDDMLVELAKLEPTRPSDLHLFRGLAKRDHDAIVAAVRAAHELPKEAWPEKPHREQETPQLALLVDFMQVVVKQLAEELALAPSLMGTVAEFKELVKHVLYGEELKPELLLSQGWRREHLKPRLESVLRGDEAIRIRRQAGGYAPPLELIRSEQAPAG